MTVGLTCDLFCARFFWGKQTLGCEFLTLLTFMYTYGTIQPGSLCMLKTRISIRDGEISQLLQGFGGWCCDENLFDPNWMLEISVDLAEDLLQIFIYFPTTSPKKTSILISTPPKTHFVFALE